MNPGCVIAMVMVGECDTDADTAGVGSSAFARPKSSTLTVPSGRSLMLAGFKSRWMTRCSCAARAPSAICARDLQCLVDRDGPLRDAIGERRPLDELHHERRDAARSPPARRCRDVGMVQRGEHFGFALKARQPLESAATSVGKHLERDVALQVRVGRAVHLAHPAHTDEGGHSVRSDSSPRRKGHRIEDSIVRTVELQRSIGGRGACATSMARRAVRRVFYDCRRAVVELRSAGGHRRREMESLNLRCSRATHRGWQSGSVRHLDARGDDGRRDQTSVRRAHRRSHQGRCTWYGNRHAAQVRAQHPARLQT